MRYYLPPSATLIGSGAQREAETDAYKVFSFMMETDVGATTIKTLQYTVDIPNCASYTGELMVTQQPGLRSSLAE